MRMLGFAFLLAVPVYSANDWSVPCIYGYCEYDLPSSSGASGTLQVWSNNNTISDITSAAGWEILNCSSDALAQDIRLVCTGNSTECDHLYEGAGAEGKLVRLPENCGQSAFARVSRAWVPDDQSIPSNIAARVVRRDGSTPEVKALTLDTDFASADPSQSGSVGFRIYGVNVPGMDMGAVADADSSHLRRRGLFDIVGDALDNASDFDLSDLNTFNVSNTTQLEPLDINQTFNLFNTSVQCGPVSADVNVNVTAGAHVMAAVGVVASGTIIPPNFDEFALTSDFSAKLNGTLDLQGDLTGQLDTGAITLFEIGIPGLDFPGLFSIGPKFQINAQATAELDVGVDMTVGLNYEIKNGHLVFPPSNDSQTNMTDMSMSNMTNSATNSSAGDFEIQDTPLQLSLSPSVQANGSVSAHLIPTLLLGVDALQVIKADVFLNLDTSATLQLQLQASAGQLNTTVGRRDLVPVVARAPSPKPTSIPRAIHAAKEARLAAEMSKRTDNSSSSDSNSNSTASDSGEGGSNSGDSSSSDISFGGCFEVLAGLSVNAGADGDLFGIFDQSTSVTLFEKEFELFKKCFGDSADQNARRSLPRSPPALMRRKAKAGSESDTAGDAADDNGGSNAGDKAVAALNCLAPEIGGPVSVVNDALKAANIISQSGSNTASTAKPSDKA